MFHGASNAVVDFVVSVVVVHVHGAWNSESALVMFMEVGLLVRLELRREHSWTVACTGQGLRQRVAVNLS